MKGTEFAGWLPYRMSELMPEPIVEWLWHGKQPYAEAFLDSTVATVLGRTGGLFFRRETSLAELETVAAEAAAEALCPGAFVFHLSRCGSTMVSELMRARGRSVVVSESGVLCNVLANPYLSREQKVRSFRALVQVLGRRVRGDEDFYLIKFSTEQIFYFDIVREAFPECPWMYLYRDPREILVSLCQQVPGVALPGGMSPGWLGLDYSQIYNMPIEEYLSRLLCAYMLHAERALQLDSRGVAMHYHELPGAVRERLAAAWGVRLTETEWNSMQQVLSHHVKDPNRALTFTPDSEAKQKEAAELCTPAMIERMMPLYERLEALRKARGGD